MPGVRVENSPKFAGRMRDITSWQEGDITLQSSREKKRYQQSKSAIEEYFTTQASIDEIARRYHISRKRLVKLAEKCLRQHEDGDVWGFRALLPAVNVIDHASQPASDISGISEEAKPAEENELEPGADTHNACLDTCSSTQTEQTALLIDAAIDNDDDDDTAKRQAIKPPLLPSILEKSTTEQEQPAESEVLVPATPTDEEQPTANLEETLVEEEQPAKSTQEPAVISEVEAAAHATEEKEEILVSAEAEEAIAEAERVLAKEKETVREDENTTKLDVGQQESQSPKVTAPLAIEVSNVSNASELTPLVLPLPSTQVSCIANKRPNQRRLIYKRWQRGIHDQQKHKRTLHIASLAIVAALLLLVLLPAGVGLAAYSAYNNINATAHDGLNHLLKVKSILNVSKSDPTAALNATKLQQAQVEFDGAERDFVQLQQLVDRPDIQGVITQFAPQYGNKLDQVQSLVQVALDVSRMGNELSGVALIGAHIIHGSPLATGSTKPLISVTDINAIEGSMIHALYYISDIRLQMSHVSVKDLPVSDAQKAQLTSLLPLLPQAQDMIVQAQGLVGLVAWLLGVGQARRFLVQTMDRAELRPGGGFTGQYGILQIQDGRMAPFNLTDVTLLDYAENGTAIGRTAPPGYSWMNFGNWGVRDSNLSGDFPTTARMTMQLFEEEGGGPVDGDIAFTPALIGHILDVTGPIKVPGYNETITSQNLEDRLHYYQQDYSAIAREKQISGNYSHSGRKAFTSTLGKMLLDRVRHLPTKQLMQVVKGAIKDIQSRDLEIYFTNPAVEAWLVEHGYSGSIDTFSRQDGFTVVQANISISKASQYVHTTEHDDVTLDAQGGAQHNLTITLDYQQ